MVPDETAAAAGSTEAPSRADTEVPSRAVARPRPARCRPRRCIGAYIEEVVPYAGDGDAAQRECSGECSEYSGTMRVARPPETWARAHNPARPWSVTRVHAISDSGPYQHPTLV